MSNHEKDTVIVYWAAKTIPQRQTHAQLLWGPPVSVSKLLPNGTGKPGNYRSCAALTPMLKNMYAFVHPLTHNARITGSHDTPLLEADLDIWVPQRNDPLKNCFGLDYDFGWLFFCEESLEVKVTPPYFHKTSVSQTAYVASGQFDIGKWFRSVSLAYILWEGERSLSITAGEPALYIEFLTNKKVILQPFECTEEINSIANQVVDASQLGMNKTSLQHRYDMFFRSNRHKRVMKLIKENLL